MFKKILIANRGEIALRVIRTCKEMGIKTVAVYSKADEESLHVRFADEAVCIGPAASSESYLKIPNIIAAAEITNADAIHPGYGFLSENSKFSKICAEHEIKFIGASGDQIDRMGDKATAKATMKEAGVPCVPGSEGLLKDVADAKKTAKKMGYPVMIKATAGGGGKGMRAVWKEEEMEELFESAVQESTAAFGNGGMYMEKLIEEPRHIEIQVVGDQYGKACHLSERDCSVQRRHQKLTEETPSPFMTDKLRDAMGKAAVKAAEYIKYEGSQGKIIYQNYTLSSVELMRKILIITLDHLQERLQPYTHREAMEYVWIRTYIVVINKMKRALDEFVIEGIKTTIPFHRQLMDHPDYLAGNYTTAFMNDWVMDPEPKNS